MNEPLPSTQFPQESLGYQPVSGWAVGGLVVSALFALLVTVTAVVGLFQGSPVFFPVWIMSVALIGIVLSWIGVRHVHNSEGTRAGAKLARIGIWLSLVSGLCYFSYYFFTRLAQESQANAFLMEMGEDSGFFPRLQEAGTKPTQINAAFLLTLPATQRAGKAEDEMDLRFRFDKPTKEGPGLWTAFTEGVFPRVLFKQLGAEAEITPMAVQEWKYDARSYKIQRIYRVETREFTVDLLMTVQSTEAEAAGGSRKWFLNVTESGMLQSTRQLTPLGEGVKNLRVRSYEMLDPWLKSLEKGQPFAGFKDLDQTAWDRLHLVETERFPKREVVREAVTSAFSGGAKYRMVGPRVHARPDDVGRWEQTPDGKVRLYTAVSFKLAAGPDAVSLPPTEVTAHMVLDSKQAIDLPRFDMFAPLPDWDIVRIVIVNVAPVPESKGPGM